MKIIVSPNSYKESLSSIDAANIIISVLKKHLNNSQFIDLPIADGGDGSFDVFSKYVNGITITKKILSPTGEKINSKYLLFDNGKAAFIELSDSSGLKLVKKDFRNPLMYNSYSTGEIILSAIKKGVKKIILALGGSATVDGGIGILSALGIKFLNKDGNVLKRKNFINEISKIEYEKNLFSNIEFTLLTDVKNKLLGKNGASYVFSKQKGATKLQMDELENGLLNLSNITKQKIKVNPEMIVGGGSAGGIAAFLKVFLNAKIYSGTDFFFKIMNFEKHINNANILITGEGNLDFQTLQGKAPFEVAKKGKKKGLLTIALVASVDSNAYSELNKFFDIIIPFQKKSTKYSIQNAKKLIKEESKRLAEIIDLSEKII
tara:strand:+ start:1249 stop:2376 length:1128 start_codon:yes stop_codon:yes gene_type:complete